MNTVQLGGKVGKGHSVPFVDSEIFEGDGVVSEFTLTHEGTIYLVEVGGQIMRRYIDYDIDDETVRFIDPPAAGTEVGVYYFARHRVRSAYTADNTLITADSTLITADAV